MDEVCNDGAARSLFASSSFFIVTNGWGGKVVEDDWTIDGRGDARAASGPLELNDGDGMG